MIVLGAGEMGGTLNNGEFFSGLALECLLHSYSEEKTRREAGVLAHALSLRPGDRVLDVACGAGRLSHVLSQLDVTMAGVDRVPALVAEASSRALPPTSFSCANVEEMSYASEFDAAFCVGTSFGYSDDAANLQFLCAVARSLKPSGRFLLQTTLVSEIFFRSLRPISVSRHGEVLMRRSMSYDHLAGRLVTEYRFSRGSAVECKTATFRVYSSCDLARMCETAGLIPVSLMNKDCSHPFGFEASHLTLVARRLG